ncbi:MAG: GAF domain-containing sensor histidine kinase [Anaerolineae bacterium]|jgi:signal transduction histidine kinase
MNKAKEIVTNRYFWVVVVMMLICTVFHYFSLQAPLLPDDHLPLTRQAVVRIIFLLPVAAAAFAFGRAGGLVTLAVSVVIMLPRVILLSVQPIDALFETVGVAVVGYILVWMIDVQDREKSLRQRAVEELEAVNAVALTLTQPYDLDAMLDRALGRVLEVVGGLESRGAIFLLDPWGQTLKLRAHRGVSPEFLEVAQEVPLGECLCGITAESGEVLVVRNALEHPNHARCPESEPHSHVCVPLKSKERLLGVIDFFLHVDESIDVIDQQMYAAIGRQVGVAVENARLCESLRFYVRRITRAQEDERRRIARELHDDTVQSLIDLSRRLDHLASSGDSFSDSSLERMEHLQVRIGEILQGVRRYSRDLRPSVLDDLGLLPAVEGLLADLRSEGLATSLEIVGEERRLAPEIELELFRSVQEALNNVRRHARATEVSITVQFSDRRVRITVQDNGRGFELLGSTGDFALTGKFGLLGMEERAQLLRGHFKVLTSHGKGTIVIVDVPV